MLSFFSNTRSSVYKSLPVVQILIKDFHFDELKLGKAALCISHDQGGFIPRDYRDADRLTASQ